VVKSLVFPMAGVSRLRGYREQTRPYSSPWAINVRGMGTLERRERGGSRPGLSKLVSTDLGASITAVFPVHYVDSDGDRQYDLVYVVDGTLGFVRAGAAVVDPPALLWPDGEEILWDDGETIYFPGGVSTGAIKGVSRAGKVYLADTALKFYDPATSVVETVIATAGTVPTGQTLVALYRDRMILGGEDHIWYASRLGDPTDWDFGAEASDTGKAVAGQLELAGRVGEICTAFVPIRDKILLMATLNTLWALHGDPATGRIENVAIGVGIIEHNAWALSPEGLLAFLSTDGVYLWSPGQGLTRFSESRVPDELRELSTSTNTISMAYDTEGRGFHLFITPSSGDGTHWWLDVENRAMWPVLLQTNHQPLCAASYRPDGVGNVVIGCKDGYLRIFDESAANDDGTAIASHVLIGPFRLAAQDTKDSMLAELHGVVDLVASGSVTWRVVMGSSAQEAASLALADVENVIAGDPVESVSASGSWTTDLRNRVVRPRARGAWVVLWLSSATQWSFEVVSAVARQLGRIR